MLLIGTRNTATQTVLTDGIVNIGAVYRKYCKKNSCGIPAFSVTANGITLQHAGIYHITATFVASGDVAGIVTVQSLENGIEIPSIFASETITTADTELRTFVLDFYVLVDNTCLLGNNTIATKTVSFENTGVDATFTSVVVNIDKVV